MNLGRKRPRCVIHTRVEAVLGWVLSRRGLGVAARIRVTEVKSFVVGGVLLV